MMERRTSLGGHLSLSTSNIARPLAESTHINGSCSHAKFPWGGKMSPAKSVTANTSVSVIQKSMPKIAISPIRKIDPRIYTDVQSNGLTSRIVKYHENSSKLNRSMSLGNLYSKPGQFPVVHLKKNEVQVKPRKNPSISVVRIAPPDKSLYQASARSSILRTGSIVPTIGLIKANEKESRDNRPILPPAENDVNPTRSVLDALKEISRKRINSEDVNCNDIVKKYCKESEEDASRHLHHPISNVLTQSQQVSVITKRQREIPTPTDSRTNSPENNATVKKRMCTKNNDISSSLSSSLLINTPKRKLQDIQGRPPIGRHSPSSSNLAPPRAKQPCNDRNFVLMDDSAIDGAYKYPPDELTPIPPTPAVESIPEKPTNFSEKIKPHQQIQKPKLTLFDKDYDTTPIIRRENDEVRLPEEEGIAGISFIKPKKNSPILSGKNALIERVQSSKLSLMLSCLSGELNDNDDEVDIKGNEKQNETQANFATPVSSTVSLTSTAPTTTTSLINIGPTVSSSSASNASAAPTTSAAPNFSFGLKEAEAKTSTPSATKTSEVTETSASSVKPTFSFGTTTKTSKSDDIKNTTTTSPAPIFNFVPSVTTSAVSEQENKLKLTAVPVSTTASTASAQPVTATSSGGFSFGLETKTSTDASSTPTVSLTAAKTSLAPTSNSSMFSFGTPKPQQGSIIAGTTNSTPAMPASTALPFSATNTATPLTLNSSTPTFGTVVSTQSQTKPLFSFGAAATTTNSSTTDKSFGSAPNFSFGSTVTKPLLAFGSALSSSTASTAAPSFSTQKSTIPSFGSASQPQTTPVFGSASSAFSTAGTAIKSPPKYNEAVTTFGSVNSGTTNSNGFGFGAPTQPGSGFFGPATTTTVATTTSSTPSFAFGSSALNKTVAPTAFNFPGSKANTTNTMATYGATLAPNTTAPSTQTPFGFGTSTASNSQIATTQSTPFSFQGVGQQTQTGSTGFNFSGNTNTNPPAFGFGGASATAVQPQTTKSFTFSGGSGASAFTAVNSNKSATGGFSFNASATAATENKTIFGSNANQPAKPFSFAGATSNKPDRPQATPVFGSPVTPANTTASTFGTPAMTPGKLFSFGGTPANNNASAAPSANIFGSPAPNNNTATPLFAAAGNITQLPFGASTNSAKPAQSVFNFSSGTNAATNNTSIAGPGAFTFGATAAQTQNANKPFAFGAAAPSNQQSSNVFGSGNVSKPPAFNFSATLTGGPADGMNNNNNNPLGAVSNPFNPMGVGTDASNIQRREIRTATRRLKPK